MKTIRIALTLLLATVALVATKPATAETAEEMLSACRPITLAPVSDGKIAIPSDFQSGLCWGAFAAIEFNLDTVDSQTQKHLFGVCLPDNRTRPQLIAIFVKYAEAHPERYGDAFMLVAHEAEKIAFPCPASK